VPSKENIACRYANGVTLILDYLDQPFGDRSPKYVTALGTCPVRYVGDEGWVETGDAGEFKVFPASLKGELQNVQRGLVGTNAGTHTRNFLDCVRSRQLTAANPIVMRSSHIACHAAALAWQLDRTLKFDPVQEMFVGDDEANRFRSRAHREPWII
jgi:hypothetical protein